MQKKMFGLFTGTGTLIKLHDSRVTKTKKYLYLTVFTMHKLEIFWPSYKPVNNHQSTWKFIIKHINFKLHKHNICYMQHFALWITKWNDIEVQIQIEQWKKRKIQHKKDRRVQNFLSSKQRFVMVLHRAVILVCILIFKAQVLPDPKKLCHCVLCLEVLLREHNIKS